MTKIKFRVPEQLLMPWSPSSTISARRAAEMLDVSPMTILRMIKAEEIDGYQVRELAGSPFRVYYDSVIAYIEAMHERNHLEKRF
jgi:excisionase family DNA binding protein